jgi:ATP-dependent RNA helicase DDX19/DBP5
VTNPSTMSSFEPAKEPAKATEPTEPTASTQPTEEPVAEPTVVQAHVDGASEGGNGSKIEETDYRVEVKLADLQQDPNNPLFSVKSFEELNLSEALVKGIRMMNFHKPSKIQEKALPLLLTNPPSNMIAQSQSGTGKTAAFSLNILTRIDISDRRPQAIALAPSRELARQIMGVIQHMGQFIEGLKIQPAIPEGIPRGARYDAHVLVGTAGTVQEALKRRTIDQEKIKILVLDEADNMLDQQGMGDQCIRVKR